MAIEYEVHGACPRCRQKVTVLDEDDPLPPHRGKGGEICAYRGVATAVRRVQAKPKPAAKPSARGKVLTRKQKERLREAEAKKVIRDGNRRLYGPQSGPRSTSVKTVSGGLPSLGK